MSQSIFFIFYEYLKNNSYINLDYGSQYNFTILWEIS